MMTNTTVLQQWHARGKTVVLEKVHGSFESQWRLTTAKRYGSEAEAREAFVAETAPTIPPEPKRRGGRRKKQEATQ